jgi:hypothetical protein
MGRGAFRALASQKCVAPEKWSPLGANLLGAELYIAMTQHSRDSVSASSLWYNVNPVDP